MVGQSMSHSNAVVETHGADALGPCASGGHGSRGRGDAADEKTWTSSSKIGTRPFILVVSSQLVTSDS